MPVSFEKIHSSSNGCLVSRRHVQEKNNNVLYYIAAENSKLGKQYELFQLNLSACLTVGLVLQPPFLMPYFSLDKMRGDLRRTSGRPIIVPKSLDDGWFTRSSLAVWWIRWVLANQYIHSLPTRTLKMVCVVL